jgi:glycolate oxidase FAD binding subunit
MPSDAGSRGAPASAPSIDGVVPQEVVAPDSPQVVAELLAEAAAHGQAIAPVGGATALALGNPPVRLDLALSTRRLGGIIDYEPTDLVLSVGAGARLGDVQAVLAEHGQSLPIDPPGGNEATIGGLIATARSGPRRLSAGTLRDLLIGISVAHPSGTITKAGGMVVKNVSGFDLPRLYHGSLGTLGVVLSANFKVIPLPRAEATVLVSLPSLDAALTIAGRLPLSHLQPAACEVALTGGSWVVALRLTGREATVDALTAETCRLVDAESTILTGSASAEWWSAYVANQAFTAADDTALVRCNVRPRDTGVLARGLLAELPQIDVVLDFLATSLGLGSMTARVRFPAGGSADRLAALQAVLLALAENVTVLAAPAAWKRSIDVWGRPPEALAVMRDLKTQFDPARVLNPGRFVAGI